MNFVRSSVIGADVVVMVVDIFQEVPRVLPVSVQQRETC